MQYAQLQALTPAPGHTPDYDACLAAFPALELAKTTPQDPRYHGEGDVWTHTKMVMEALLALPQYQAARSTTSWSARSLSLIHI